MSANLDDGIAPSCAAEKDAPAVESRWSFAAKKIYMAKGGSMSLLIKKELRMTVSMISHVPLS